MSALLIFTLFYMLLSWKDSETHDLDNKAGQGKSAEGLQKMRPSLLGISSALKMMVCVPVKAGRTFKMLIVLQALHEYSAQEAGGLHREGRVMEVFHSEPGREMPLFLDSALKQIRTVVRFKLLILLLIPL